MDSTTYKDIIDDKLAAWQTALDKVAVQAENAAADTKASFLEKSDQLKDAIDAATIKLRELDERETVENTLETKDKILALFSSIDKEFSRFEEKTPFML